MTTNSPGRSATLRAALDSVLLELDDVERQFSELAARRDHLREAASGLNGLLGTTAAVRGRVTQGRLARARSLRDREVGIRGRMDEAQRASRDGQASNSDGTEAGRTKASLPSDATSTDRVVALLREFEGRAIPRGMIFGEFAHRGWVDPDWKEPEAAIRMAIRRAVDRSEAKDIGGGRYVLSLPGLFTETDHQEDDA